MKYLILLLLVSSYGHGTNNEPHSRDQSQRVTNSNPVIVVNTNSASSGAGVESGERSTASGETVFKVDNRREEVANSAAPVVSDYCSGGGSLQGKGSGISLGGTESSCRKQQIREMTINEMYRQSKLGNAEKASELSEEITILVDDTLRNEKRRNWGESSWTIFKAVSPWVVLLAL